MDQSKILLQIAELSTRIHTAQERLSNKSSAVHAIDVALLKKNCIELYELILALESGSASDQKETFTEILREEIPVQTFVSHLEEKVANPEPAPEPVIEVEEEEENVLRIPEAENSLEKLKLEKPTDIPEVKTAEPALEENQLRIPLKQEKPEKKEEKSVPAPVKKTTVHEKASADPGTKIYEKFNQSKIESIRKNISLMKRFEYQKALFKDNSDYYNDAIRFFDDAAGLTDALSEFEELGSHFGWDMESGLVLELRELITRRHM